MSEVHEVINVCQNGFRKNRSTVDQLSCLTTILENRKTKWRGQNKNKAKSFFFFFRCLILGHHRTPWFNVECGLRQGCNLSPLLFNIFINEFAEQIQRLNRGVVVRDNNVSILMYADDIVLIAETETNLQIMLNTLYEWCSTWGLVINNNKSAVVHFRSSSTEITQHKFVCGSEIINIAKSYKYLGVLLTDTLDYNVMVKNVAQAANRALDLLISKVKLIGGVHYKCFTQQFDTFVWSVISYSACIWGTRNYGAIKSVFNRACRFFLGLGQHAPVSAVRGAMGMVPPLCRQMKEVARQYSRQKIMSNERINYMIFNWASSLVGIRGRGWAGRAQKAFVELDTLNDSE